MQRIKQILLATFILIMAASCNNELVEQKNGVDPAKVFKTPSTPNEKLLVQNLGKVTEIFKELYRDKSNLKVVNAAIYSKAYTDESVLLKDLIDPPHSRLNKVDKFLELTKKWNVSLTDFSTNFWANAEKKNDDSFNQFLNTLIEPVSGNQSKRVEEIGDQVTIYFPYSEEFIPTDGGYYEPITSLVTATADADEGLGASPYYDGAGTFQFYVQIVVNDDFVFNNPTQIIGVNGIEIDLTPTSPPPPPPPPPGVSRIFIGEGICKKQYDRLISFTGNGGGSEIKYCHLSGYLQPVNGQITTFQDIASVDFSRRNIHDKNWQRAFIVWDDDWVPGDLEQVLGIYEEDNTNTVTFTGSLSTTLKIDSSASITGSIGFSITRQSQDDIIRQLKISRNSYFAGAFQDQAWGFSADATFLPLPYTHGWPIYDATKWAGANVGWTWPYNTF
jgi:hypothetical protein